jgi:hypothetical protein
VGQAVDAVEQIGVFQVEEAQFRHGWQVGDAAEGDIEATAMVKPGDADGGQGRDGADGQHVSIIQEFGKEGEVLHASEERPRGADAQGEFFETGERADGAEIAGGGVGDVERVECGEVGEGGPIGDLAGVKMHGGEISAVAHEGDVAQRAVVGDLGGEAGELGSWSRTSAVCSSRVRVSLDL